MAGLSGPQAIIDVVAASERLRPSKPARRRSRPAEPVTAATAAVTAEIAADVPEPVAAEPGEEAVRCIFGHENHQDFRFCATCGVPMHASVPGTPADAMRRPRPVAELSPAERAERERQHAEALAAAARFEQSTQPFVPTEGDSVLIHFIADGLTAFGQVWYRGQELEIGPAHPRWAEARGWITLGRFEQVERWGEQKFDFGPWPGRSSYAEALGSFEQLTGTDAQGNKVTFAGPTEDELRAADAAERRRGRAVPAPAFR